MPIKTASAVMAALVLAGCAATTPPPRFSAVSPADADGPESALPAPAPALAREPEAQASASPAPEASADAEPYTCPMHPEVREAAPGSCPKCGMALVRRKDGRQR